MHTTYEELDRQDTELGRVVLRRRWAAALGPEPIYEIEHEGRVLASSLITEPQHLLVHGAIEAIGDGVYDVLVGGLGLGDPAWAALGYRRVRSVTVIEPLHPVVAWHRQGLLPLGTALHDDPRCRLMEGDFFPLATDPSVRDLLHPHGGYGAILVAIDHAPSTRLHASHRSLHDPHALGAVADLLQPGGALAVWSPVRPKHRFERALAGVFPEVTTLQVEIYDPLADAERIDTVYVARRAGTIPIPRPGRRATAFTRAARRRGQPPR